ncbi:MAG: ParB/RepB/Spo0J family partition protein [Desulfurivibrionaceae bacterium]
MSINVDTATYEKGKLYEINLDELQTDPQQPRKSIDPQALEELAASVTSSGVLQPIIFRLDDQGNKVIVAGERRTAAARKAGLATIPAILIAGNYAEIAMVENLLRQDLTSIEEAEGLQALMNKQQYTQEQLGGIIGKAQNTLSEILSLNRLPQEVRDDCRGNRAISRSSLIVIAKKKQARAMTTAYNAYKAKLQKAPLPRQKQDRNAPQAACLLLDKAATKLTNIDTSAWPDEDKANLQTAMVNLKAIIDTCLNDLPPVMPS